MSTKRVFIDCGQSWKVGDPCPSGYMDRYDWALVHLKSGLKQELCGVCLKYQFPHELTNRFMYIKGFDAKGKKIMLTRMICKICDKTLKRRKINKTKK